MDNKTVLFEYSISLKADSFDEFEYLAPLTTKPFNYIEFKIIFQRNIKHHLIAVFVPMALIVLTAFAAFWLTEIQDRITLAITSLLALVTQSNEARREYPPISYATSLDSWIFICLLFNFVALLETVAVHVIRRRMQVAINNRFLVRLVVGMVGVRIENENFWV